jgi:hypothetical protein
VGTHLQALANLVVALSGMASTCTFACAWGRCIEADPIRCIKVAESLLSWVEIREVIR